MKPCLDYECMIQRLREGSNVNDTDSIPDTNSKDGLLSSNSTFRILLPIILVLGVFVFVITAMIFNGVALRTLKKYWPCRRGVGSHHSTASIDSHPERRVYSISGNSDDLPSYGQVIEAMRKEGHPPPYQAVGRSTRNLAFTADVNYLSNLQPLRHQLKHDVFEVSRNNHFQSRIVNPSTFQPHCPSTAENSVISAGNPGPGQSVLHGASQDKAIVSDTTASGSLYFDSSASPKDQSTTVTIQDIEEIINTISVPSLLSYTDVNHLSSTATSIKTKRRNNSRRNSRTITAFTSSLRTFTPKHGDLPGSYTIQLPASM